MPLSVEGTTHHDDDKGDVDSSPQAPPTPWPPWEPPGETAGRAAWLPLGLGVVAAVLVGVFLTFVGRHVWLELFYEVMVGAIIGSAMAWGLRRSPYHNRRVLFASAAGCVVLAYASLSVGVYVLDFSSTSMSFLEVMELRLQSETVPVFGALGSFHAFYWLAQIAIGAGVALFLVWGGTLMQDKGTPQEVRAWVSEMLQAKTPETEIREALAQRGWEADQAQRAALEDGALHAAATAQEHNTHEQDAREDKEDA